MISESKSNNYVRSMIANLPGKTNNFMGDNLELVCLLQAAEIERLNQYLS